MRIFRYPATAWPRDEEDYEPSGRCGSLRRHDEHLWTGQTTGKVLLCPGYQPRPHETRTPVWLRQGNGR